MLYLEPGLNPEDYIPCTVGEATPDKQPHSGRKCTHHGRPQEEKLWKVSKRIYRRLGLSGYARLDYRMNEKGDAYLLEANPNPNIAKNDEFATSAMAMGLEYPKLLERLLRIGMKRPV